MPHQISECTGDEAKLMAVMAQPFGPGLTPEEAEKVERVVVMGSSFNDPGDDWCEFQWFDVSDEKIGSCRVGGF